MSPQSTETTRIVEDAISLIELVRDELYPLEIPQEQIEYLHSILGDAVRTLRHLSPYEARRRQLEGR